MGDRTVTLAEFLVGKVGLSRGTKVASFVVAWGIYTQNEAGPWSLEGYSRYWGQSISSTYRERDLFQICWPEEKLPDRVWSVARAFVDGRFTGAARARDRAAAQALVARAVW